jgi:hypothetical protein
MERLETKKVIVILLHAFVGWAMCTASIGIGMAVTSVGTALIIHAVVAPIAFSLVTFFYIRRFHYTSPLVTAIIFVSFVIVVDFFLVALAILGSLEMFTSLLGTWIPFILIFLATYGTGLSLTRKG